MNDRAASRDREPSPVGTRPLARHLLFVTDSRIMAVEQVGKLLGPHELRVVDPRRDAFTSQVNAVRFHDTMLASFEYGAEIEVCSPPVESVYGVNWLLTGRMEVEHRGVVVQSVPGVATVLGPTSSPTRMRWSRDTTVLSLTIARGALERQLERMTGRAVTSAIEFRTHMAASINGATESSTAGVRLLLDIAESGSGHVSAAVAIELERAVMTSLLLSQPHQYREALTREHPAHSRRVLDEAIGILHNEFTGAVVISELAERVGVSERSLQQAFRASLGVSPTAYLRQLRLDHTHRILRSTAIEEKSITQVAFDSGFAHMGRFAAAYRSRFGELPSRTRRA